MKATLITLFLISIHIVSAAHSRKRPQYRSSSTTQYDRSITTFSSDGLLNQVAYGMEAASRGDTVVAAILSPEQAILVMQQDWKNKIHRINDNCVMATSGLAGDARALASLLRSGCQRHVLSFGEAPTTKQVAEMASKVQHDLTKTAGARPLGCSAIIVGSSSCRGGMEVYMTDPGGVLEQCKYCAIGKLKSLKTISECYESNASAIETTAAIIQTVLKEGKKDEPVHVWTISTGNKGIHLKLEKSS